MIAIEPKERVTDQKTLHFFAAVVENVAFPFRVIALPRIGMLVEMRAVKKCQAMFVAGKMRRHPVENDADAAPMQDIDQVHEVLRCAKVGRRRKITGNLITP